MNISLNQGKLSLAGTVLFSDIPAHVSYLEDPSGVGGLLRVEADEPFAHHAFALGSLPAVKRFTCCHRTSPFWMRPTAGTRAGQTPPETQFLLAELNDGQFALFVPLLDGAFRATLTGVGETGLELIAESGDPATTTTSMTGLFVAVGDDPFTLVERCAPAVNQHLGTGRLRRDKAVPAFVDQFGWCTYDAFYHTVSKDKIRQGLESFATGGIVPKYVILDDGWLSQHNPEKKTRQLYSFVANEKFPGDLSATIDMCKNEFGVKHMIVWHAITGSWAGVDGQTLAGYGVRQIAGAFSETMTKICFHLFDWWSRVQGVVSPEGIDRFYHDFHRHLRRQGVDGLKVDGQSGLEGVAGGMGGRVALMQRYHEALEGSAHVHFAGNLINCMSCSNEMLYSTLGSTVVRTSDDFYPARIATHGLHLYTNSQVCLWFGEFVLGDWDMFQSGHPQGVFHAIGRAVSGSPIYVSDKVGGHDFALLKKLILPDGAILRARQMGRPTRDCLFADPTQENVLLKIFNLNLDAGVVGVFNARHVDPAAPSGSLAGPIAGAMRPRDVEGLAGERFAVYAHLAAELRILGRDESWPISLAPLSGEMFTIVPLDRDRFAPIGLADMFNSAGAIDEKGFDAAGNYRVKLRAAGRFLAWSQSAPMRVEAMESDNASIAFTYKDNVIELLASTSGTLRFVFADAGKK